jgi:thioredoxin-related protein
MKRILSFSLGLLLAGWAASATAAESASEWLTDFKAAMAKAKTDQRPLIVNFTGSDWCPWCIKLHDEIFEKAEFKDYAKKHLVLAIVDFPRTKPQTDAEKKTARELAAKYKIKGYPTVVVFDAQGKEIGTTGYLTGGPKAFIDELEKIQLDAAKKALAPK